MCAQTGTLTGIVRDVDTRNAIIGASVRVIGSSLGVSSSTDGSFTLKGIPAGEHTVRVSHVAYQEVRLDIAIYPDETTHIEFFMHPVDIEESEVVVTGTRTTHNIADVPVRIEAIPQEEIEEKVLMTPSNVAMLLNESTGARVQTTSSTSGALNVRIQGLSGRYTQVLLDGIPSFGGMAGGFGLTQLVPLNLRQVEMVKGAGSALYGPDAIAGIVNFLTKEPREDLEATALLNGTTQKGFDAGAFAGEEFDNIGFTIFVSKNVQGSYDVDGDYFADIPKYDKFSVAPKMRYGISENLQLGISLGYLSEERVGGLVEGGSFVPAGSAKPYLERINIARKDVSGHLEWKIDPTSSFGMKIAMMSLDRNDVFGLSLFDATQNVVYGEAEFISEQEGHQFVAGAVLHSDNLNDHTTGTLYKKDYSFGVPGLFLQDEIKLSDQWILLLSGRADFHNRFGTFLTPRASIMHKPSPELTLRAGFGGGFKAPTVFVEESELLGYQNTRIVPDVKAEKATSASFDINWKTIFEQVAISVNCALYTTLINNALIADDDSLASQRVFLRNATGRTYTRGGEVLFKISYEDVKLTTGYTYTYATQEDFAKSEELELNPRHSFGAVAVWEDHKQGWKVGLESYWTGRQRLERNPYRKESLSYWNFGAIAEKSFGIFRIFVNFENIFDTRQTRFERIFTGTPEVGAFTKLPIYAPLEGRVINGGVRVVL